MKTKLMHVSENDAIFQESNIHVFGSVLKNITALWFGVSTINSNPEPQRGTRPVERRLHSGAVGQKRTADALLSFLRVHSIIWRCGSPSRTKSQGQISWLCGDNSWEEQTRKSLHFIKDPAGEQQSFSRSPTHKTHASLHLRC